MFDPLGAPGITADQGRRIFGVHACLWSEKITPFKGKNGWLELKTAGETADYKTYPRLCALAEMGWTPQARRDYANFAERLGEHYQRLQVAGIMFRVPMVEATAFANKIDIHSPVPKAEVLYTLDGSDPLDALDPKKWDGKPVKGDAKQFRARVFIENRASPLRVGATMK
jgi:hexosaminidase